MFRRISTRNEVKFALQVMLSASWLLHYILPETACIPRLQNSSARKRWPEVGNKFQWKGLKKWKSEYWRFCFVHMRTNPFTEYAGSPRLVGWNHGKPGHSFSDRHTLKNTQSCHEIVFLVAKYKDGSASNCVLGTKNSESWNVGLHSHLTV